MCALSEPRGRIERMARRRKRLYLAPTGRHVYSRATCKYLKAPEGRYVYSGATCALCLNHQLHGGGKGRE